MSPSRSAATASRTRAFSLSTWRARRRSGSGSPSASAAAAWLSAADAEQLAGACALGAALVVATGGMRVALAGVQHDQAPVAQAQRHVLDVERLEVDEQRAVLPTEQRGELVEQSGVRSHPVVLHARAQARERQAARAALALAVSRRIASQRRQALAGQRQQREAQRDLQRRRRGQPGAARQVAVDLQARAWESRAGLAARPPRRARTRASRRAARGLSTANESLLVQVVAYARHAVVCARLRRDHDALGDRERQRQARRCSRCARRSGSRGRARTRAAQAPRAIASRNATADSSGSVSEMNVPAPCSEPARNLSFSAVRSGG